MTSSQIMRNPYEKNEDRPTTKVHVDRIDYRPASAVRDESPHQTQGQHLHGSIKFGSKDSNNEAEYEALIAGLKLAQDREHTNLGGYDENMELVLHQEY
uniref:RNase H type-1 domain-containing protein n=1 Tax=Cannabis sativa TaxID=3483 RepID=A0A803NKG6_CANSA